MREGCVLKDMLPNGQQVPVSSEQESVAVCNKLRVK
jgi:hypothetical protein